MQLTSTDGHARVTLAAHHQTFTASYLVRIPEPARGGSTEATQDGTLTEKAVQSKDEVCGYSYVWTTVEHSATIVPSSWRHPVDILLQLTSDVEASGSQGMCVSLGLTYKQEQLAIIIS